MLRIEPCGWPGMMEKSLDCPLVVKLNIHSGLVTLCAQLFAWTTYCLSVFLSASVFHPFHRLSSLTWIYGLCTKCSLKIHRIQSNH